MEKRKRNEEKVRMEVCIDDLCSSLTHSALSSIGAANGSIVFAFDCNAASLNNEKAEWLGDNESEK